MDKYNFGHLIEGVVEQNPITDLYQIRTERGVVSPNELLKALAGKEVRLTLAAFEDLQKLAEAVERAGGGDVVGVQPEDIPVPFNVVRRKDS